MKITILTVGKIKEDFYRKAIAEYSKRLSRYCKLEIIEVTDEKTPDSASAVVEEQIKDKEGERLLKYIREDAYVIALAIEGKMLDSIELSKNIEQLGIMGKSHIIFVIGGSLGLSDRILKRADYKLSFSAPAYASHFTRTDLPELPYYL